MLEWNVILHVRLYGCMRVLNALGLGGRRYLDELCAYCDSSFPNWRRSKYIGPWLQNADIRGRVKARLILGGRWHLYLMANWAESVAVKIKHAFARLLHSR